MKKRVFDYIKENKGSDLHEIAKAISEDEMKVLKAINDLSNEGYICLCPPVPLSINNSDSCRYMAIKKDYTEK